MLSTSFLRTLNPKKYQDFAEENRNRLRVFYIRAVLKLNKQTKQHRRSKQNEDRVSNRCVCKHELDHKQNSTSDDAQLKDARAASRANNQQRYLMRNTDSRENTQTDGENKSLKEIQDKNNQTRRQWRMGRVLFGNRSSPIDHALIDFQSTRIQCERRLQRIEKQSEIESRKLAYFNSRKTADKKLSPNNLMLNIEKPSTARDI